jgi:hypothetical protein
MVGLVALSSTSAVLAYKLITFKPPADKTAGTKNQNVVYYFGASPARNKTQDACVSSRVLVTDLTSRVLNSTHHVASHPNCW